jgi:hypothetical protein
MYGLFIPLQLAPSPRPGTATELNTIVTIVVDNATLAAPADPASDTALRLSLQDALAGAGAGAGAVPLSGIRIASMVVSLSSASAAAAGTGTTTTTAAAAPAVEDTYTSYSVQHSVTVILEDMGYSASEGGALYASWVAAIDTSVASGEYSGNLAANAESNGAEPLSLATVSETQTVGYSGYVLTVVTVSQEGNTYDVTLGTRIGYLSFIIFMAVVSAFMIWSFFYGRKIFMAKYHPHGFNKQSPVKRKPSGAGPADGSTQYEVSTGRTTFATNSRGNSPHTLPPHSISHSIDRVSLIHDRGSILHDTAMNPMGKYETESGADDL